MKRRQKEQQEKIEKQREWNWKRKTFYITTTVSIISIVVTSYITIYITKASSSNVFYYGDVVTYQLYGSAMEDSERTEQEIKEAYNVSVGKSIAILATEYCVGNPFVWGGTSLSQGADSSGLVMSLYGKYGIELPHSSTAISKMGEEVNLADIRDGDIVCYESHVGIYIGENLIVHASNARNGIIISDMFYREPLTIRRFDFSSIQ